MQAHGASLSARGWPASSSGRGCKISAPMPGRPSGVARPCEQGQPATQTANEASTAGSCRVIRTRPPAREANQDVDNFVTTHAGTLELFCVCCPPGVMPAMYWALSSRTQGGVDGPAHLAALQPRCGTWARRGRASLHAAIVPRSCAAPADAAAAEHAPPARVARGFAAEGAHFHGVTSAWPGTGRTKSKPRNHHRPPQIEAPLDQNP